MNITQTLSDIAIEYAQFDWYVFPVQNKQPLVRWREESTNDLDRIRSFDWARATGIGLDCGKSSIVVIDVDDVGAVPLLAQKLGWDPVEDDTYVAYTGGGGYHIYYKAGDQAVRNSASKVVAGIDVRGDGGYVVLPPSDHVSGLVYRWYKKPEDGVRPIPEKLVELLNYREERPEPPAPAPGRVYEKWAMAVLAEEAAEIENAMPGTRNDQLNTSAFKVYGVVKGGHLDKAIADIRLESAAARVGLDSGETAGTLRSAWDAAEPRHPAVLESPVPYATQETSGPRKTFRALGLEELTNLPPPQWILPQRLPEGQTWMYGVPGSGKTFLALDWSLTVASTGLGVLYFVGEGVQGFARRVLAWRESRQRDISTFHAIPQAPHLLERQSVEMLRATVEQHSPSLIVIDTFARASVGGDENSARDVGLAIDALDMMLREYGTSSLVLHHSNKTNGSERGSSAIRGAADATWEVRPGTNGDMIVGFEAVCRKMKDAEPPRPLLHQLRSFGDSAVLHPPTVVSHTQGGMM